MDRANRVLWSIIGVVLIAAGALTAAASMGWLPGAETESPLLWAEVIEQWQAWEPWVWLVVAVIGLLLAWLGWRLIRAQFSVGGGHRMRDLKIDAPDGRGHTVVGRSTLAHATEQELERLPGVDDAAVRLLGEHREPEVQARLEVRSDASLSAVASGVSEALDRFTATSGLSPETVDVTVELAGGPPSRVS